MITRQDIFKVKLAIYFEDWALELGDGTYHMSSLEYQVEIAAREFTESIRKARELLGDHLAGLKIVRTTVMDCTKIGEVYA